MFKALYASSYLILATLWGRSNYVQFIEEAKAEGQRVTFRELTPGSHS